MGKKRNLSVFDAIQELESEDAKTEKKRRQKTSTADVHRARAAQSQVQIYNHLVACRILLQRALTSNDNDEDGDGNGNKQDENDQNIIKENCDKLLNSLLQARSQLMKSSGEDDTKDDDDENNNNNDDVNKYSHLIKEGDDDGSKDELEGILDKEYGECREQWKEVLNRRHKDVRLTSGLTAKKSQFRVMDSSFWEQVEATVEYENLRGQQQNQNEKEEEKNGKMIFDDSKVYQQLLKDFVASSTVTNDAASKNRLLAKKNKNSKKKEVDRRASKGRKIRYKEIPKLVNFTFPLSRPQSSTLDRDEWFQSLFGGAGKI